MSSLSPEDPSISTPMAGDGQAETPLKIVRVVARLNVGGPALQAITLADKLNSYGYRTRLVRGTEGPSEGNMDYLADANGVKPTKIARMRRDPGLDTPLALGALARLIRNDRPDIVHTHAAMAGALGRMATVIAFPNPSQRPVLVHTYDGHSLTGYFSDRTSAVYRRIEQTLAPVTDKLIAVSGEVRDDLVRLGVAPAEKFRVIPHGFDLSGFSGDRDRDARRQAFRDSIGLASHATLVSLVARLVPIKRVDRFLQFAHALNSQRPDVHFAIVGDGELRESLQSSADAVALGDKLIWTGFRQDIPDVCYGSDLIALTSDNEGTPVSLIEAQAAGLPVVATDVGGVRTAISDGVSGRVVAPDDLETLVAGALELVDDAGLRARYGAAGRAYALEHFGLERLLSDHASLYGELLSKRASRAAAE